MINILSTINYLFSILPTTTITYQIFHSFLTNCIMFEWDLVSNNPLKYQKIVIQYCIVSRKGLRESKQYPVFCFVDVPSNHLFPMQPQLEICQQNFDINFHKNYLNMKDFLSLSCLVFLKLIIVVPPSNGNHCILLFVGSHWSIELHFVEWDWSPVVFW